MPGLLDFLKSDDAALGIGLLAAGGPTTDPNRTGFGQRLQGVMQGMDAQTQQALRNKLLQSQIDENTSQDAMRKQQLAMSLRQMQMQNQLLGFGENPTQASPAASAAASGVMPATTPIAGSAPAIPNGTGAPVAGMPSAPPQQGAGTLDAMSKQYGIPAEALKYDLVFNGGKGIAEMVAKRGTPDMQVSNGYAYDKNKVGPGYLPQLNMSQDGKASMVQIGPNGQPVVSAPQGAVDTYSAYQGAQANYKPIKVYNPATQREEFTSEGAVVAPMAGGRGNVQSSGYAGGDRNAANAESIRIIQSEMAKPGNSPADIAAMQREVQRLQLQSGLTNAAVAQAPAGGVAAGPSMQESARGKFNDKMAAEQGDLLTKSYTSAQDASNAMQGIQESRKAMQAGAFQGTGAEAKLAIAKFGQAVGINIDPEKTANTDYLKSTLGNGLLEKAKTLGSNPSNADASRITDIVGSIGKDPNAMSKILDWQEEMARKSINGHNTRVGQAEDNGFKSQFDMRVKLPEAPKADAMKATKVLDALPTPNGSNKGQRIRDTTTGKILVSNGLQWKEE
jgi:hypothetical protein